MLRRAIAVAGILAASARAQLSIATNSISAVSNPSVSVPTGVYISYAAQITLTATPSSTNGSAYGILSASHNSTGSVSSSHSTTAHSSATSVILVGTEGVRTGNSTATSTAAAATNTQACNNYVEFCARKYSNITEVCAHNSAFVKANNAFSNQDIPIIGQLNDGVRMIQGEVHYVNNTLYSCHSSCDFLNAGTYESELTTVREWVADHPFDVVTVLIVNSDYALVENFTTPIINSGLIDYVYTPPKIPMYLDDWPTLTEMILTGKRVVVMMDYMANQTAVPYILDEFSQMWETPFSPTNTSFPCNAQRPPNLSNAAARNIMYMANHNLNVEISLGSDSLLIPNFADLNVVNAANGTAPSLGAMANLCRSDWDRPPNFLLVDFYNEGNANGSVFEVAAQMNGVTYSRSCCGYNTALDSAAYALVRPAVWSTLAGAIIVGLVSLL